MNKTEQLERLLWLAKRGLEATRPPGSERRKLQGCIDSYERQFRVMRRRLVIGRLKARLKYKTENSRHDMLAGMFRCSWPCQECGLQPIYYPSDLTRLLQQCPGKDRHACSLAAWRGVSDFTPEPPLWQNYEGPSNL